MCSFEGGAAAYAVRKGCDSRTGSSGWGGSEQQSPTLTLYKEIQGKEALGLLSHC